MAEPPRPVLLGRSGTTRHEVPQGVARVQKDEETGEVKVLQGVVGARTSVPILRWFQMLYATFGSFVLLAVLVYGVQQGFAHKSDLFASKYIMMDELNLDGATISRLLTAAHVPWNMKPVFGILSDAMPIFGYHKRSYLVLAIIASIALYTWVALATPSVTGIFLFMLGAQFVVMISDLVVDAASASLAQAHPSQASDLQTVMKLSEATGGTLSGAVKGILVSKLSPRGALLSNLLAPVILLFPALRGWLPEERLPSCCTPTLKKFKQNSGTRGVTAVAVFLSIVAVTLSVCGVLLKDWRLRAGLTLAANIAVAVCSYKVLRKISPYLGNCGILLFFRATFSPGLGEVMFVWMSKDPDGPLFSPEILGFAECFGQVGIVLGVLLYNTILRRWKFCHLFLVGQLLVICGRFLDLILVMRWNRAMHIPDFLFFAGDSAFDHAVVKAFYLPLAVLAYKVCPKNLEATVFSTLMALNNIGFDCGRYMGVTLCEVWGLVGGSFDHLPHATITRILIQLVPIPLIWLLSPDFTPDDPIPSESEEEAPSLKCKAGRANESL